LRTAIVEEWQTFPQYKVVLKNYWSIIQRKVEFKFYFNNKFLHFGKMVVTWIVCNNKNMETLKFVFTVKQWIMCKTSSLTSNKRR
jgi:hypothetical protein